jgi:hypothetical protein
MLKMQMGGTWCTQTSMLVMFKKFEKKFGRPDSEDKVVGRMYFVHPAVGEHFFLYLLLTVILGATFYESCHKQCY